MQLHNDQTADASDGSRVAVRHSESADETVVAVVVDMDDFVVNSHGRGASWADAQLAVVADIVDRCVTAYGAEARRHVPPDEWVVTFAGGDGSVLHERAMSCARELTAEVRDATELTTSVGVSPPYSGPQPRVEAERQAHAAIAAKLVGHGDCVLDGEPADTTPTSPPRIDRELARCVKAGDRDTAARLLRDWIDRCAALPGVSAPQLQEWVIGQLLFVMDLACGRRTAVGSADWIDKQAGVQLADLLKITEIHDRSYLRMWVSEALAQMLTEPDKPIRPGELLLRTAEEYINANLTDPTLTLGKLAREISVSPHHLAHLFRSERDTTFLALLTGLRIQAARRLLDTSDVTVEHVARMTGYPNARRFRETFKREVGCTPTEYRSIPENGAPAHPDASRHVRAS